MCSEEDGLVRVEKLVRLVEAMFRVLRKMRIHIEDPRGFVEVWLGLERRRGEEEEGDGSSRRKEEKITLEEFKQRSLENLPYVTSLGILSQESSHQRLGGGRRRGNKEVETVEGLVRSSAHSIVFGHKHWELVQAICWGIRVAVGEATHRKERQFKGKDFKTIADFDLTK
jgi:hypothetical protein